MNEPLLDPSVSSEVQMARSKERTKRVAAAGWTAGTAAVFCTYALTGNPTWPLAAGVAAIALMIGFVCWMMLASGDRRR